MEKRDLIRLRTKIVATLAGLETTTANTRSMLKESAEVNPNFLLDECDAAKGELDLKNTLNVHNHSTAQQRLLSNALTRMDSGEYGLCEACREEIGLRRLEVMPSAAFCIQCQEEREVGFVPDIESLESASRLYMRWAA